MSVLFSQRQCDLQLTEAFFGVETVANNYTFKYRWGCGNNIQ